MKNKRANYMQNRQPEGFTLTKNGIISSPTNKADNSRANNLIIIETIFGWGALALAVVAIILIVYLTVNGEKVSLLRALIFIPFGIWYGIHCLNKAKKLKEELNNGDSTTEDS